MQIFSKYAIFIIDDEMLVIYKSQIPMNFLTLILKFIKNPTVFEQLVKFVNQTMDLISPTDLEHNEDYRALRGKELFIRIVDANIEFTTTFENNSIQIQQRSNPQADLVIVTTSNAISSLVNKEVELDQLTQTGRLKFSGNSQLLIHVANLSIKIDSSPENILAKYVGDVPAYFLNEAGKNLLHITKSLFTLIEGAHNREHYPETNEDAFRDDSLEAREKRANEHQGSLAPTAFTSTNDYANQQSNSENANGQADNNGLPFPFVKPTEFTDSGFPLPPSPKRVFRELGTQFFPQDFPQLLEGVKFFFNNITNNKK